MNRQALRNNYPFHGQPQVARGFTPKAQPKSFSGVMAEIFIWGMVIASGFAVFAPIVRYALRHV